MARTKFPVAVRNESPPDPILALRVASEVMASRSRYAYALGMSFGGARDLYQALGYKKTLTMEDYWNVYRRGRLGRRIVNAPVESTWRGDVRVLEDDEPDETDFEAAWKQLDKDHGVISKLVRADKLAGLGEFGVLLLGFNDNLELSQPLTGTNLELIYMQPYHQGNVQILAWEQDTKNPRYGMPLTYSLQIRVVGSSAAMPSLKTLTVHHSRVIHIAEGLLDNDVFGTSRLESVFNGLGDLEKIAGGSAEMYWQGALGGKAFTAKDGATLGEDDRAAMQTEIDDYIHKLRRYLRLQNVDVQDLSPQVSDPTPAIGAQLDLISGDTGIPKRILVGSERGELASTQDESNWLSRIYERQRQFAEPCILRPVIDLLIKVGALPTPADDYQIVWPDLQSYGIQEQATAAKTVAEAFAAYMNAPGAEQVMPIDFFFREVLKFSEEQVEQIQKMLEDNPPPDEVDETIDEQERLEAAGMHPLQQQERLAPAEPDTPPKGKAAPKGKGKAK